MIAGQTLTVSDPSKGLIANDSNVYGVAGLTPSDGGTLSSAAERHIYLCSQPPVSSTTDSFKYCANGSSTACATVTLGAAPIEDCRRHHCQSR